MSIVLLRNESFTPRDRSVIYFLLKKFRNKCCDEIFVGNIWLIDYMVVQCFDKKYKITSWFITIIISFILAKTIQLFHNI